MSGANVKITRIDKKKMEAMQKEIVSKKASSIRRLGILTSIKNYADDTIAELKKVNWLRRRQVFIYLGIVLLITVFLTVFVWGADLFIYEGLSFLRSMAVR